MTTTHDISAIGASGRIGLQGVNSLWELTDRTPVCDPNGSDLQVVYDSSPLVRQRVDDVLREEAVNLVLAGEFIDLFFVEDLGELIEEFRFRRFFESGMKDYVGDLIHVDGLKNCLGQVVNSYRPFIHSYSEQIFNKMQLIAKTYVNSCKDLPEDSMEHYRDPKIAFQYTQLSLAGHFEFSQDQRNALKNELFKIQGLNLIPSNFLTRAQDARVRFNKTRLEFQNAPLYRDRPVVFLDFLSQCYSPLLKYLSTRQAGVFYTLLDHYRVGVSASQMAKERIISARPFRTMLDRVIGGDTLARSDEEANISAARNALERLAELRLVKTTDSRPKIYFVDDMDLLRIHAFKDNKILSWCRRNEIEIGRLQVDDIDKFVQECEKSAQKTAA